MPGKAILSSALHSSTVPLQEDKNIKCSHTVALHYIRVPSAALSIWLLVAAKSFTSFRRLFSTHLGADLLRKVFCLRLSPPEHSHSTALHAVPQPGLSPAGLQCLPTTASNRDCNHTLGKHILVKLTPTYRVMQRTFIKAVILTWNKSVPTSQVMEISLFQ